MRKEAENWFKQAKADLKTANDCLSSKNYYACAFFSQQVVEKALKAYYIHKKEDIPPKTHNLLDLSLELKIPKKFISTARELTPEFIITRYPDAAGDVPARLYDKESAKELLEKSKVFFRWLEKKLK